MIIVIEGCDATGKTTLARKLKSHYESQNRKVVIHHSTVRRWALRHHLAKLRYLLRDYAANRHVVHIFDRLWPSECIYGALFRDFKYSQTATWLIDFFLTNLGASYVWCFDDVADIVERHAEMSDLRKEHFDNRVIKRVAKAYDDVVFGRTLPPWFGYLRGLSEVGVFGMDHHFALRFGHPTDKLVASLELHERQVLQKIFPKSEVKIDWEATNHKE